MKKQCPDRGQKCPVEKIKYYTGDKCRICGKPIDFEKYDRGTYAYKKKDKKGRLHYYCSWCCIRQNY